MQVNKELLKEWFMPFNEKYFNGELPEPAFAVGKSRTRLGSLTWRVRRKLFFTSRSSYTLRLSNYYDADENRFKSVLLHEMIHLYIVSKRMKDTSPHGRIFRKMMSEINADGWNITVTANTKSETKTAKTQKKRKRLVLAVVMKDGRRLLSAVNPKYANNIDRTIRRAPEVAEYSWHTTDDDYFADFPTVRTPKGRIVKPTDYDTLLSNMQDFHI